MKKVLKRIIVFSLEFLFHHPLTLPFFNFIFENGNDTFRSFVIRNLSKPEHDFIWESKLYNNKYVKVPVSYDNRSWQFAYNYKWHNPGLSKVEQAINDYYPVQRSYIDIGANFGLRTLYAMSIGRRCLLFEPNEELKPFTKSVYALNKFDNYKIERCCVSDKEGIAKFYISNSSYQSSLNKEYAINDSYGGLTKEIEVQIVTLDDYLGSHELENPCIIKIDAEGSDYDVLKGGIKTITNLKPTVIVEVNSKIRSKIIELMVGMGYSCYGISGNKKTPLNSYNEGKSDNFLNCQDLLFVSEPDLIQRIKILVNN